MYFPIVLIFLSNRTRATALLLHVTSQHRLFYLLICVLVIGGVLFSILDNKVTCELLSQFSNIMQLHL